MNDSTQPTAPAALEVRSIRKHFAGTKALDDVSLTFRAGAVTALLGPNGCGKSTLIKILAGFHQPDTGEIRLHGNPIATPVAPREAYRRGLRFVHQDLGLVDGMSVADNLGLAEAFAGRPALLPIGSKQLHEHAKAALLRFSIAVAPDRLVGELSRTDQIMVAIARAFASTDVSHGASVVVLDEPTASLPAEAVDRVLAAVELMRDHGGSIVYVTHRIDEVLRVADDVAILRDGRVAAQQPREGLDASGLASLIMGSAVPADTAHRAPSLARRDEVLVVDKLTGPRLTNVSFAVHRGEVLGVAGLAGCGRSELARMLAGVQQPHSGTVTLGGRVLDLRSPRHGLRAGIAFVPPERIRLGLVPDMSARLNITLGDLSPYWRSGFLQQRRERSDVAGLLDHFNIRPRDTEKPLRYFSGGNQQKAVIANRSRLVPQVLVIDEPTQGVDVRGKQEMASVIRSLADDGCAVVIASSDLDEVEVLCDRVVVLDRGRILGIFDRGTITEQGLALLASTEPEEFQ